ncbi:unannotated protein [freshwater metagenome]|uniref:Unannotated protein n=1 Tax=freshwater metagenome TaxID=449393 RepID=A0A6J7FZH6_9ZZZZ|nr:hypothetical protein [Actinomycetota bacterium]
MGKTPKVALACAVLLVAGGGVAVVLANRSNSATSGAHKTLQLSTVTVVQKDLTTYTETTATLGFTTSTIISSPVAGTVTTIVTTGDTVDAGNIVATIDGNPVVALIGDIPGYRDLSTAASAGADIRQLEINLVSLGFDPNAKIHIDETYDSATAAAVTLWEDSLGLVGNGKVPQSEVVYIPGKVLVDTVSATVGGAAQSGSTLLTGRLAERRYLVTSTVAHGGVVDRFAAATTAVATGTVLFWDAGMPVVAIEGDANATPALERDLKIGSVGADVKVLEQMLSAGGFDPTNAMTIDDHFDAATSAAVTAWWQSLGMTVDTNAAIVVPAGSYVVVPSGLFVGNPTVADGTTLAGDATVLSLTRAAREVTTTAPIGDATFALGATIDVEFPDATIQPGIVVAVGNVATNTSNTPGATPSVPITIHVDTIPPAVDSFVQIPVTLRVVADSAPRAFVVPVSALVALAEGGYAIEVVTGKAPDGSDATKLIAVTPGLFANGFVAITGDQVQAGQNVVVPS